MLLKLPKLDTLVSTDKDLTENSQSKVIKVKNGYAYIQNGISVIVNLREYIKIENSLTTEEEIKELDEFMAYVEGKTFSKDYWKEMTKQCYVSIVDDEVLVEYGTYNKFLQYTEMDDYEDESVVRKYLLQTLSNKTTEKERFVLDGTYIQKLQKAFSNELKTDQIMFSKVEGQSNVKFTFLRRDYIFGLIQENQDKVNNITAFLNLNLFDKNFTI